MNTGTQKVGICLGLPTCPLQGSTARITQVVCSSEGVVGATVNRDMPDVVEVEYDPCVTTPYRIYRTAMNQGFLDDSASAGRIAA